jgi:hypothetical protein
MPGRLHNFAKLSAPEIAAIVSQAEIGAPEAAAAAPTDYNSLEPPT